MTITYDPTGFDTFAYRMAPDGLATRRQLRAAGLRPGGHDPVAQILWRRGKRVAYLYRLDLAAPKRIATPAQREAIGSVMPALFGTGTVTNAKPPQWVAMKLAVQGDVAKFDIAEGKKLAFEIENVKVPGAKLGGKAYGDRVELSNTAPWPWVSHITQGISHKFHYDDFGITWDYSDRNAFFGVVSAKGTLGTKTAEVAR